MAHILLKELGVDDLYEFLGVPSTASAKDVRTWALNPGQGYDGTSNHPGRLLVLTGERLSSVIQTRIQTILQLVSERFGCCVLFRYIWFQQLLCLRSCLVCTGLFPMPCARQATVA